jgi:hypothetical protein
MAQVSRTSGSHWVEILQNNYKMYIGKCIFIIMGVIMLHAIYRRGLSLLAVLLIILVTVPSVEAKNFKLTAVFAGNVHFTSQTTGTTDGTGYFSQLRFATSHANITVTGPSTCTGGFMATQLQVYTSLANSADTISVTIVEEVCPFADEPGIFTGSGTYTITGGTGNFANIEGNGFAESRGDFSNPAAQHFILQLSGNLSH